MRPFLSCCLRLSSASSLGGKSRRKLTPLDSLHDVETLRASTPNMVTGICKLISPEARAPAAALAWFSASASAWTPKCSTTLF